MNEPKMSEEAARLFELLEIPNNRYALNELKKYISRIERERDEALAKLTWRPIDSADKGDHETQGDTILVAPSGRLNRARVAFWAFGERGEWLSAENCVPLGDPQPTHWMPLPPPPNNT